MEEVYKLLIKNSLTPNQLYLLDCVKNKIKPILLTSVSLEAHRLVEDKWLIKKDDKYSLSDKAFILVNEIESYFKKTKKKTNTSILGDSYDKNIESYIETFPKEKLPSGKYARVNKKTIEECFRWFFNNYNYDWSVVLKATQNYVDEYYVNGYKYMRTSQYFIRKAEVDKTWSSELANYCDAVLNGSAEEQYVFKQNIV